MSERRKLHRRHLIFYLRLQDARTGELMGFLGDISPKGLLMISEQPLAVGRTLHLQLLLPHEIEGRNAVELEAVVRRCAPDYNPQFHAIGMEVNELEPAVLKVLEELVQEMGFKD